MKSHFKEETGSYGFNGLIRIFNKYEIDHTNWITKEIDEERGGIEFQLPSAYGKIYLTWGDFYRADITFANTQKTFNDLCSLADIEHIIKLLEEQRERHVDSLRTMLMKMFKESEEE